ncbi:MAG: VanZ family protein [Oscillospiraceae bacterium]|nr:VanZ family protein [Oscillospiraceae bacterium]
MLPFSGLVIEEMLCWGGLMFLLLYGISCVRNKKAMPLLTFRQAALLMLCFYGAALLSLTGMDEFLPGGRHFLCNPFTGFDMSAPFRGNVYRPIRQNFMLFVPLGILVPLNFPKQFGRFLRTVLLGFAVSLVIELLQGFIGRQQELDDLIINTAGTAAGFGLWAALFRRRVKISARLVLLLLTVLLSAAGLRFVRSLCAM